MNRVATDTAAASIPVRPLWLSFWFAFILLALIVSGIGAGVYLSVRRTVMQSVYDNLESIARIKVGQMERRLGEARRQADLAMSSPLFVAEFEQWLREGTPASARRARLLEHLHAVVAIGQFRDVDLRSAKDGTALLSTSPPDDDEEHRSSALRAVEDQSTVLQDFRFTNYGRPGIGLGFHSPIGGAATTRPSGAVHIELDPAVHFLPFLNQWPGRSPSAETLLFRVDGDEVVYLNHSRHENGAPLAMRRPVSEPTMLAAQAARGRIGALSGTDYRGVASIGFALPVVGTPWFLIAKVDESEAMAGFDRTTTMATLALLCILLTFAGWKTERSRRLEADYRVLFERSLLSKRLEFLARYTNEGILLADTDGRIIEANELCAAIYGRARDELVGTEVAALWGGGYADGDACFEVEHRRQDGSTATIEVNLRMVDIDGVRYLQALVRDVTARRQAEGSLRQSERRASRYAEQLEDLYQNAPCGYHSIDADGLICRMNDTELTWLGYTRDEVVGRLHLTDLTDEASGDGFRERFSVLKREGHVHNLELVFRRKNGTTFQALVSATAIYDDDGNFVASRTTVVDSSHIHMLQRERDRQARRVEQLSRHLIAVQEEERRRLSCELQDRASPNLAAIKLTLDTLARSLPGPALAEAEERIADADALLDDTIVGVREVCADLRPSMLDYGGLMRALVGYTQQYARRTGLVVRLKVPGDTVRLGAELESILFRIVQEALANVVRHAGAASVDVVLHSDEKSTVLTVKDDGVGFDTAADTGLGIRTMRERAEFAGGAFRIASHASGTEIRVEFSTPHDTSDSPWHRLAATDAKLSLQ